MSTTIKTPATKARAIKAGAIDTRQAALLTLSVVSLFAATACKVQPLDHNRVRDKTYLEPIIGAEAAAAARDDSSHLGPAATEAIKNLPLANVGNNDELPGLEADALSKDEILVEDRYRIGFPAWERGSQSDSPYDQSRWWDPYHQNWLKGDYPIPGTQNTFLNLEVTSLTRYENRKVPLPSGVFPRASGTGAFFGKGNQTLLEEQLIMTMDLFQGETSFKPVDWRLFIRGQASWNRASARENQALYADPQKGTVRYDQHLALQQAFFETTLGSINDKYDVVQLRLGTQLFTSDFKGFMFTDEALGARLFGSLDDNRWQWNVAQFRRWNKDTNSSLNELESNKQNVFIANLYRQDILEYLLPRWKSESWSHGLFSQVSFHHYWDDDSVHYDRNDFLVRPRQVGTVRPTESSVSYLGWTNDGHVGRLNITSALYKAFGHEDYNAIADQRVEVDAMMAALELSVDVDWMRFRAQAFYQSGDGDIFDGKGEGFDAVFDNPNFAGGEFGFWNRNTIRLTGSGVGLVQRFSLLNSLRSSKDEGQPTFVNPGLLLAGVGYDAALTPHVKVITNASYLTFDKTDSLEYILNQDGIGEEIGYDLSVGVLWRPMLVDNVIVKGGVSALVPGKGFRTIYGASTLYAFFAEVLLTW